MRLQFAALATAFALAAGALAAQDAIPAAPSALDGTGATEADGVFPRNVTDETGATVTIPAEPQRVVVIQTGQLDGALTLGVVPVGAARGLGTDIYGDYHLRASPDLADQIRAVTDVGGRQEPDIEAIAALEPDLIFINKAAMEDASYAALQAIAPVVVTRGQGVNWKIDFLLIGAALGRQEQAQAWLDAYAADADAYAARWNGDAPTVSLVHSNGARTRIMGVSSFAGSIAADLGLARPAAQNIDATSEDISAETLDLADADWIFYSGQGDGIALIEDAPLWPTLEGVAAGHAVFVEYEPFYFNAGPAAARIVLDTLTTAIE